MTKPEIKIERQEALRKFQVLVENKELFQLTAGLLLTVVGIDEGVDTLMTEYRWYAQIAEAIITDTTDTVTDDEKEKFIEVHTRMLENNKIK